MDQPDRLRLSRHAFTRFWHAHAWAGVVTALLVYVMFFLGSVVLFYRPLTIWEEPLLQRPPARVPSLDALLRIAAPESDEFYLYLPDATRPLPKVGYYLPDTTLWRMWWLDVASGERIPEREKAAAFVYDLHYLWHDLTGFWLQYGAGVLVFGFLLALVTGALIQWGRFRRQLYRFRPGRERRVLWSDLHKVAGVFGLPFQLAYALTGSMMVLSPLLFELSIQPVFGGDVARAAATAGALVEDTPELDLGPAREPLPLDELVSRARAAEPRLSVESIVYHGYGRAGATLDVRGPIAGQPFGGGMVHVMAATGHVHGVETPDRESTVGTLARWIHGIHTVEYGGPLVRWLLFVLALGGCATLLTGNWIWLERRAAAGHSRGDILLARLTAGVGVGCFAALAALLLSSRLLPLSLPRRILLEELAMAGTFGLCLLAASRARRTRALWWRGLAFAGALLGLTPLAALLHSQAGLFGSGPSHPDVLAVDAALLGASLVLLASATALRRHGREVS
ncbi:MAG TPA: PepSY-associated TM helix domain-containing protein [Polyangiaceae bacterium]|nr:PepSY-associated TM helix domain-containing protein [Polyangiaceae bacterium]